MNSKHIMLEDIPIVLHTCDKYSKFWNAWWFFMKKHCEHKNIIFVSENKKPDFHNDVKCILTGEGEWGWRILEALKKIDSEYIFYTQEDMWPIKKFPVTQKIVDISIEDNVDCFRISFNSTCYALTLVKDNIFRYNKNSLYSLSHQFSLWRKDFFTNCIHEDENPWVNEIEGSKRINKTGHKIYMIKDTWYIATVNKGKLGKIGLEMLQKNNLEVEE